MKRSKITKSRRHPVARPKIKVSVMDPATGVTKFLGFLYDYQRVVR